MSSGQTKSSAQFNDIFKCSNGKVSPTKCVSDIESATTQSSVSNEPESYPEMCRSKKEKECWKLFQKMLNKGVNVSYDTILRGMLTPTELRAIQKQQKEFEEAAAAAAELAETTASQSNSSTESKTNVKNNIASDNK